MNFKLILCDSGGSGLCLSDSEANLIMSFVEWQDVGSTVDRAGNAQLTAKLSVNLSRWLDALSCPFRVHTYEWVCV